MSLIDHKSNLIKLLEKFIYSHFRKSDFGGGFTFIYRDEDNQLMAEFGYVNESIFEKNCDLYFKGNKPNHIGSPRSLSSTIHCCQEKGLFSSGDHLYIKIDKITLNEVINIINENPENRHDDLINNSDFFFFDHSELIGNNKESIELLKIPLIFLTSPIALFCVKNVFSNNEDKQNLYNFVSTICSLTQEYVNNYVYTLLLENVLSKSKSIKNNSLEFIKLFCDELAKLTLPLSYEIEYRNKCFIVKDYTAYHDFNNDNYKLKLIFPISTNDFAVVNYCYTNLVMPIYDYSANKFYLKWQNEREDFVIYANQVQKLISQIFIISHRQWIKQYQAKQSALQNAISQIFARNYAHNIGSHVAINSTIDKIYKRVQDLYEIKITDIRDTIKQTESIEDLLLNNISFINNKKTLSDKETRELLEELSDSMNPVIVGPTSSQDLKVYREIFNCIKYLKTILDEYEINRNEFISNPNMPPITIKLISDLLAPFWENTLLIDNLCASEKVRYRKYRSENRTNTKSDLQINVFFDRNGEKHKLLSHYPKLTNSILSNNPEEITYPYNFPYLVKSIEDEIDLKHAIKQKEYFLECVNGNNKRFNDIDITILSVHSVYSIFENIIRNSAKHNKASIGEDGLQINIEISEKDQELDISIIDNVSSLNGAGLKKIYQASVSSILDEDQEFALRSNNLGMADLRINGYLLKSSEEIKEEHLINSINVLFRPTKEKEFTIATDDNIGDVCSDDIYRIGYRIKIAKAKRVCWIGSPQEIDVDKEDRLKRKGIYFFNSWKDLSDFEHKTEISIAAWEFVILEKEQLIYAIRDEKDFESLTEKLPFRILINSTYNNLLKEDNPQINSLLTSRRIQPVTEVISHASDETFDDIYRNCWVNWLKRWVKDDFKVVLGLFFDSKNEEWDNFRSKYNKLNNDKFFDIFLNREDLNKNTEKDKVHFVIFDHHGGMNPDVQSSFNSASQNFLKELIYKYGFYQPIGKNSHDFSKIFYPGTDYNKVEFFCYELIEAGLCNILVMDERLNASYDDKYGDKHLAGRAGELTNTQINLWAKIAQLHGTTSSSIFKESRQTISEIDNNLLIDVSDKNNYQLNLRDDSSSFGEADILIIHRTFLTASFWGHEDCDEILKNLRKLVPFVIVTTGGGKVNLNIDSYKYKPFSLYRNIIGNAVNKWSVTNNSIK